MKKWIIILSLYLVSIMVFHHDDGRFESNMNEIVHGGTNNKSAHGFDWIYVSMGYVYDRATYGYCWKLCDILEDKVTTK